MSAQVFWNGRALPFRAGETIAATLQRAGIANLGPEDALVRGRIFCAIGACQACIVAVDGGAPVEACITPARDGLRITSMPSIGERDE